MWRCEVALAYMTQLLRFKPPDFTIHYVWKFFLSTRGNRHGNKHGNKHGASSHDWKKNHYNTNLVDDHRTYMLLSDWSNPRIRHRPLATGLASPPQLGLRVYQCVSNQLRWRWRWPRKVTSLSKQKPIPSSNPTRVSVVLWSWRG